MKSNVIVLGLVLGFVLIMSHVGSSQNLGYVFMDSLLVEYPDYNEKVTEAKELKERLEKEVKGQKKELNDKMDVLFKNYDVKEGEMIEDVKKRMKGGDTLVFNLYMSEGKLIEDRVKAYSGQYNDFEKKEIMTKIDHVKSMCAEVAKAKGYDHVVSMDYLVNAFIYYDTKKNLTKDVLVKVRKLKSTASSDKGKK